jgi:hypothetical protein
VTEGFLPCLPPHFGYLLLRGKPGLGARMAGRFAKLPAGIQASIVETNRDSARKAEGPRPRPGPWKDRRLVISRSAALSPCPPEISKYLPLFIVLKSDPSFFCKTFNYLNSFIIHKKGGPFQSSRRTAISSQPGNLTHRTQSAQILWGRAALSTTLNPNLRKKSGL